MEFDRRGFAMTGSALLAMPYLAKLGITPAAAQAPAPAPATMAQAPGFFRFKVGSHVITVVNDGYGVRPNPTQGFVRNAESAAVEEALKAAFLPTDALRLPYTVTFLQAGEKLIAFDTGTGGQLGATAGRLAANAQAAGIDPEKVTEVVLTHFHGDHISGLTTAENKPVFTKAQIIVPKAEWAFWTDEGNASRAPDAMKPAFAAVKRRFDPYQGRIRQISDGEVVPGVVALSTPGHTPGHTSYLLSDGSDQVLVLGDVTNRPELNLEHPGWHLVFDMDAETAEKTRRTVFDRVATDRIRCIGYHFPFPANGYVAKAGDGYRFIPADWSSGV